MILRLVSLVLRCSGRITDSRQSPVIATPANQTLTTTQAANETLRIADSHVERGYVSVRYGLDGTAARMYGSIERATWAAFSGCTLNLECLMILPLCQGLAAACDARFDMGASYKCQDPAPLTVHSVVEQQLDCLSQFAQEHRSPYRYSPWRPLALCCRSRHILLWTTFRSNNRPSNGQ